MFWLKEPLEPGMTLSSKVDQQSWPTSLYLYFYFSSFVKQLQISWQYILHNKLAELQEKLN